MRMLWVKCVSFEQKAEFFSSQKKRRGTPFRFYHSHAKGSRHTCPRLFGLF